MNRNMTRMIMSRIRIKKGVFSTNTRHAVGLTKQLIRSKILALLKQNKEEDRIAKSNTIKKKLFKTLEFKKAKSVMFYIAFGGEVQTREMIEEAHTLGKTVAVPYSKTHRIMRPCIYHHKLVLKKGIHGTCEPAVERFIRLQEIDLVIVPGVAFDKKGNRLGRGKGCYDYFLKKLPAKTRTIGLAYDFQIIPSVPSTLNDVKLDKVLFA